MSTATAIAATDAFESGCGSERRDDFSVLIRKYGSQVKLELAPFNEPDDGRHMRSQPRRQFLRLERLVTYVERRGPYNRAGQRAAADLGTAFAYLNVKRQPIERPKDFPRAQLQILVRRV